MHKISDDLAIISTISDKTENHDIALVSLLSIVRMGWIGYSLDGLGYSLPGENFRGEVLSCDTRLSAINAMHPECA